MLEKISWFCLSSIVAQDSETPQYLQQIQCEIKVSQY